MGLTAYTAAQIGATEKPHLEAGAPLMARASHGLGVHAARLLTDRTGGTYGRGVVILAGSGNNGGDALYAGAHLCAQGARVTAVLTGSSRHEEGLAALLAAGGRALDLSQDGEERCAEEALGADLIVDGMLGTGGRGGLREAPASLVRTILERRERAGERPLVVACDVPSGLDASTGEVVDPVLPADLTVTFIGAKSGLLATPRPSVVGEIRVIELGIEDDLPEPAVIRLADQDFGDFWPVPREGDQKYSRGVLGTVVGSDQFPGAGLMCVRAAVSAGAGMVRFVGGDSLAGMMALTAPEAVRTEAVGEDRVQAWAVGSGATGRDEQAQIERALDEGVPLVADAAAIDMIAHRAAEGHQAPPHTVLTPHAGELAQALEWLVRLDHRAAAALRDAATGAGLAEDRVPDGAPDRAAIESAPLVWARAAQSVLGGTILLKGTTTIIAGPTVTYAHSGNSHWLATAGSGDTLSGILGAGIAGHRARVENGVFPDHDDAWAGVAAAGLLVQRRISTCAPGPVPPTLAAQRIPAAVGHLFGE